MEKIKNRYLIRPATRRDIQELLTLYFLVYSGKYPFNFGTEAESMARVIEDAHSLWLVAVDEVAGTICGSCTIEVEIEFRIGRIEGLLVHPSYLRQGIAKAMLKAATRTVLEERKAVHSVYATTRTTSIAPQLSFLSDGFKPLGIFPNARRLARYETLTLMGKFGPGVLEQRKILEQVPEIVVPLLRTINRYTKSLSPIPPTQKTTKPFSSGTRLDFEMILAPQYVEKNFVEKFPDPWDRFYPFHKPNLLIASTNGEVEIYAHFSQNDGYCTLISCNQAIWKLGGRMKQLMEQLRDFGAAYVEAILSVDNVMSIEALLDVQFLPSAIYPAMLEQQGQFLDMVLMTRSLEPLNFSGIQIDKAFKPFVDQYIDLWKKMHLDVLSVFQEG